MKKCKAIILAAGKGQRLGDITKDLPKPLLEINDKTLIGYAIDFVKNIGIQDIVVVAGYHFEQMKNKVKEIDDKIKVTNNPDFNFQNLVSLSKGLEYIKSENLLVCNADYIFKKTSAEAVKKKLSDISVFCSYDLSGDDEDVMKVKVSKNGDLIQMSKQLMDFGAIFTGICFFESKHIPELKKITKEILENNDKNITTVENIFNEFVKRGFQIKAVDIGKADWFEIDTPEELAVARKALNKS
jgi:choline kinase